MLPKKIGIRVKILSTVIVGLIFFFILEAFIIQQVFVSGFSDVEEQDMVNGLQRVEGLIDNEINNYSTKLSDWANWDDTYKFISDKNQAYINSNLGNSSLSNLKVNFMIFIASDGAIFYEKGVDFDSKEDLPLPKDLRSLLSESNIITRHENIDSQSKGIIRLSNGFIFFVSRPILTSSGEGPIRGTLIFIRYIDKTFLDKISTLEHSEVSIHSYYDTNLPSDFAQAKELMSTEGVKYTEPDGRIDTYFVNAESANSIDGFTVVNDIFDKPAFIIENQLERPYWVLEQKLVTFIMGIFAFISLTFILLAFILLNQLVVKKITALKGNVIKLVNPSLPDSRLTIKGNDEFTDLAININLMLDKIEGSEKRLKEQSEALKQKIAELEKFQNLTVGRELRMIELKKRIQELEEKQKT